MTFGTIDPDKIEVDPLARTDMTENIIQLYDIKSPRDCKVFPEGLRITEFKVHVIPESCAVTLKVYRSSVPEDLDLARCKVTLEGSNPFPITAILYEDED